MTRRPTLLLGLLLAVACKAGGVGSPTLAPTPVSPEVTQGHADSLWRQGVTEFRRGDYDDAGKTLQRALLEFSPGDSRIAEAHFFLAESYLGVGSQLQAVREFRKVSDDSPSNPLAPDALVRAGDAYAELWTKPQLDPTYGRSAIATYTELLNRYPDSPAAARARDKLAALSAKFAYKDWETAQYYLRNNMFDSAIIYLKSIAATYPNTPSAELALVELVRTYRRLGYIEDATEVCGSLRQYHAGAKGLDALCPVSGG